MEAAHVQLILRCLQGQRVKKKEKVFILELLRLAPHSPPYQQHFSIKAGVVVVTLPAHSLLANSISNLSTTVVLSLSPISSFHHQKLLGHDDGHRRFPCTGRSFFYLTALHLILNRFSFPISYAISPTV